MKFSVTVRGSARVKVRFSDDFMNRVQIRVRLIFTFEVRLCIEIRVRIWVNLRVKLGFRKDLELG